MSVRLSGRGGQISSPSPLAFMRLPDFLIANDIFLSYKGFKSSKTKETNDLRDAKA